MDGLPIINTVLQFKVQQEWSEPDLLAFEYGGIEKLKTLCGSDSQPMREQVPRLYQLTQGHPQSD